MGEFHEYDTDFDKDAALSSSSFLTPLLNNQPRSRTNYEDPTSIEEKVNNTYKRLEKLKTSECSICLYALNDKPYANPPTHVDKFAKTPCNHRFHKECLVDWMAQKYQCPLCRSEIPEYKDYD